LGFLEGGGCGWDGERKEQGGCRKGGILAKGREEAGWDKGKNLRARKGEGWVG
jgi:hypothetical protein